LKEISSRRMLHVTLIFRSGILLGSMSHVQRKMVTVSLFLVAIFTLPTLLYISVYHVTSIWISWSIFLGIMVSSTVLYIFWLEKFDVFELHETALLDRGLSRNDIVSTIENTIMDYAKESIIMFHGALSTLFFDHSKIIKALRGEKGRKLTVRVVFGPQLLVQNHEFLKLAKQGMVILYQLREEDTGGQKGKFHHFVCVDGKHTWLEYDHEPGKCDGGKEWINEPIVAGRCISRFKKLVEKSREVSADSIIASIGKTNFVREYDHAEKKWTPATETELRELAADIKEEI